MSAGPRRSLRRRLTALCSLLTVLALALTGIESYRRERRTLDDDLGTQLATVADMVAINSRSGLEFDDARDVAKFLDAVVTTMRLQAAAVYARDGRRFAASGDPSLSPLLVGQPLPAHGDRVAVAELPYKDQNGEPRLGCAMVRTSGEPNRVRMFDYARGLVVTALLAMLVLGLAAHWLLARLLRPIGSLVATTHEVRRTGNWSVRASSGADDEVGALVTAFNELLAVIQERDRHLAQNAERLEQQVRERTAELSRALQAAESATQAKSTFVANMSHEIRTPLNAILGMTELAMEAEDPREVHEYLGVIRSAGSNLLGILCDILDLSKVESGKLELSPVPVELEALVLDGLRPLTSRIQSKNLELTFEMAADLAPAYLVDDVRLRQILTNLVGNAIKFTAAGSVEVSLRRLGAVGNVHEVELAVQDTGVGIPADRLQAIFTPFTQADNTITRRYSGTGLGLSITARLVRLMGGTIHVSSTVGVGSTFRVVFPMPVCDSPLPPPPALANDTRLLLVGAAAATQRSWAALGRRLGIEVAAVADIAGLRGLQPLRENDFVLLDERDPDHDPAVAAIVPIGGAGARPLFVATSFQDLASASARCRAHQFAGYLTKPVSGRELAVRVHHLRARTPATLPSASPKAPGGECAGPRLRMLVAEDNAVNQKLIERILQRDGHEVTIAENGRVCCDLWSRGSFDIVLMDMQMPEMSGLEATRFIRREEANSGRRVPIVALTANTTPEDRESCLHAGMDEVLPKPVSIPRLRSLLAQLAWSTSIPLAGHPPDQGAP